MKIGSPIYRFINCTCCHVTKYSTSFPRNGKCYACREIEQKEWIAFVNKIKEDKIKAADKKARLSMLKKEWYLRNREKVLERRRELYKLNREGILAAKKESYQKKKLAK